MVLKKMKNKLLSILLVAAVTVTAVPSIPVTAAMPEGGEELYVSEDEPASDDLEQMASEDMNSQEDTDNYGEEQPSESVEEDLPQQSESTESLENSKDFSEAIGVDVKAVGTNGIEYSDVAYLSVNAYNRLPEDAQEVYMDMCDSIAEWKSNGEDVQNIVISVDETGELHLNYSMPVRALYTSDAAEQYTDEITQENSDDSGETKEDTKETVETTDPENDSSNTEGNEETNGDTEDKEITDGDTDSADNDKTDGDTGSADNKETDADSDNDADSEKTDEDANTTDPEENVDNDNEDNSIPNEEPADDSVSDNDLTDDVTATDEEASDIEDNEEGIIAENTELAETFYYNMSSLDTVPIADLDTLLTNGNYFKNQLDSIAKTCYDVGKKHLVDTTSFYKEGNLNYKGYGLESNFPLSTNQFRSAIFNSISALINMYPNSFNWMDLGSNSLLMEGSYQNGKGEYTVILIASSHYNDSLESQANAKVTQLVNAAVQSAVTKYPANPTYGIIEYLDNWICANNYYNWVGTYDDDASKTSDTYFYCHSCYGILLKGYGVCESYALAMSRLLDAAGIRNQYIMGDARGGHAWNYVQMPDNKWYMLDSTWNDSTEDGSDAAESNKEYLLVSDDGIHQPTGMRFTDGKTFKFEKLSTTSYVEPDGKSIALKPKGKFNMSVKDSYYSKMVTNWSSADSNIAKINSDGQITAGSKTGKTEITMTLNTGNSYTIPVYVYKVTNLTFQQNNKPAYTDTYVDADANIIPGTEYFTIDINVSQSDRAISAEDISKCAALAPTVTSSNTKVAVAYGVITDDIIKLHVYPIAIGKSKITVKFADKTASYTLNVKYGLQESWFTCESDTTKNYPYNGKAQKPKVTKKDSAPKDVKYKVAYVNNKNAGTATINITGTGNYAGTITKNFTITGIDAPAGEVQFVSCAESLKYNGAGQVPKTKVKVGSKTLKAGADYILLYDGEEELPKEAGTYKVTIKGNNYNLNVTGIEAKELKIENTTIDKVKFTCPSSIKSTGGNMIPAIKEKITAKIGKNVLEESVDYTVTFCDSSGTPLNTQSITEKGTYKVEFKPIGKNVTESTKKKSIVKTIKVK